MKILMLNYEFPPMGGGAGNATDNISKNLALAGHDVTVLTSRYGEQPSFEVKNGVKIYRVFTWRNSIHDCGFKGAYTYLFFAAVKLMEMNRTQRFDILHFFFSLPTGLLSLLPWTFKNNGVSLFMKILMLNYEFPPMGGGAGNATDNISKNLALAGHDVTVLTLRYGEQPSFEVKNGVKIYRMFSWGNSIHDCGFKGAYTYLFLRLLNLWK